MWEREPAGFCCLFESALHWGHALGRTREQTISSLRSRSLNRASCSSPKCKTVTYSRAHCLGWAAKFYQQFSCRSSLLLSLLLFNLFIYLFYTSCPPENLYSWWISLFAFHMLWALLLLLILSTAHRDVYRRLSAPVALFTLGKVIYRKMRLCSVALLSSLLLFTIHYVRKRRLLKYFSLVIICAYNYCTVFRMLVRYKRIKLIKCCTVFTNNNHNNRVILKLCVIRTSRRLLVSEMLADLVTGMALIRWSE